MNSPFLSLSQTIWLAANDAAFAVFDSFPVTPGHVLVVTRRVVATWFEATEDEQSALMSLVNEVKLILDERLQPKPDGYNVGFNAGEAAGQTVPHLHVHVIPRYRGDVADPRGGIRHVIPGKGNYLAGREQPVATQAGLTLATGHPNSPLWNELSWRLAGAKCIDVLVSFVQLSGLDVIEDRLFEAIRNDGRVRILVSDYLYISDAKALWRLMGWANLAFEEFNESRLQAKLIETNRLPSSPASFHPKAWQISDDSSGLIVVGSSNLSRPALQTGVEWNLLSERHAAPEAHDKVRLEFSSLWDVAAELSSDLLSKYAEKAKAFRSVHFEAERIDERQGPYDPRPWQIEALDALQKIRHAGYGRALVAVATGMGKTWLAAFDAKQIGGAFGRRPRVLVIAHRAHILAQAEAAISLVLDHSFGEGTTSWYIGGSSELDGDLVIASIQKLSRPSGLDRLAEEHFDFVVMDEVHHAHAPSYRRVLARLHAGFILGLTATPERTDGVDVASIFDDNLAYHASIGDGIAEESLVPFHYVGIKDTVDFGQIPWRNGRFALEELEDRVIRSERMDRLWLTMQKHSAERTIVFCCSRRHALFTRDWLRSKGLQAAAVFSGGGSDSYSESLENLRRGNLKCLCVVDMFNEGLDIPAVDRVIMLRPTESKVIFLQQLGRGLRASEGKSRLLVIDFVGNHRIFAQRLIHILSLHKAAANWTTLKRWLNGETPDLPDGCLVDVEVEAKDLIRQFIPAGPSQAIEAYRAIRDELGRRPTVLEVFNQGFLPRAIAARDGSWFEFCRSEGDLNEKEAQVCEQYGDWLKMLETTALTKSYKMIVLRVLLDQQSFLTPVQLNQFARECRRYLQNHEVLRKDLQGDGHAVDHALADDPAWTKWWNKWPIDRWTDLQAGNKWFVRDGNQFQFRSTIDPNLLVTFESLTAEIVDWRLAQYVRRWKSVPETDSGVTFEAKVSHSNGKPILFVPEKTVCPGRPVGPKAVRLPDGSRWEFKFVKVACNVAAPDGEKTNQLSDLLRNWFGPNAGLPGTGFVVRFTKEGDVWSASPVSPAGEVVNSEAPVKSGARKPKIADRVKPKERYTTHVPVYDLTAAAGGWGPDGVPAEAGWVKVVNEKLTEGMFVAQVVGRSMEPKIADGAWCLFKPCPAGSRNNRLLLIQCQTQHDPEDGGRYTVKKYRSTKVTTDEGWSNESVELLPLNPEYPSIQISAETTADLRVIGEFVCVLDIP
jgi:superfamily II DNA or RNA helicase/diadenosine tetraphosphate (Ap4A) HIT family hydrolase/HKD family nuclease/phage repressor protein C with HTH and peptisase S24 domain